MLCYVFAAILAVLSPTLAAAKEPIRIIGSATVTKVSDGDTIQAVTPDGTKLKVRLYGIDAPETEKANKKTGRISKPGQPYGKESQMALMLKVAGRPLTVEVMDIDRYKRLVSILKVEGRDINREMVREGHAWAYRQYLDRPHASEYIGAEAEAIKGKKGLWQERYWTQGKPQPPWEFRKMLRIRGD